MPVLRRLRTALLATAVAAQASAPGTADASAYMRLQGSGYGTGLGGTTGGTDAGGTTGTTGGTDTTGTGGAAGGSTAGSATAGGTTAGGTTTTTGTSTTGGTTTVTPGGGNVTTGNTVTAGRITVTQNTDRSVTTTTQGTDGTVTKVTKQPDGSSTTVTTTPAGKTTETTTDGGGNVTTAEPVTGGEVDGTGTVTAHVRQAFRAQFVTTSTGSPVWQLASPAPSGVTLSSVTGALTGAVADEGAYPVQVTDGIVAKPYGVNLNVIPPLDVVGRPLLLRRGTYASTGFWAQNVVGQSGETLSPLPNGLVFEPWGYLHGTPTDASYPAAAASVTVQDSGDAGPTGTVTKSFPVTYYPQPLAVADYPDLTVTVGTPVAVPAPATGGDPVNPTFSAQGNLPEGLSLDRSTGAITGTPTSVPSVTQLVMVTMSDDTGASVTTDPFRVGPAVGGTGMASSEYPVLATDFYCTYAHSQCSISFEGYYTQSGDAPRPMFSGIQYTYAHPVVTDGTLDLATADGNTDYVLLYNASTTGDTNWQPVVGTTLASQYLITPSNSNNDYGGGRVLARARIGNAGAFPGWEPYMPTPVTVALGAGGGKVDLPSAMGTKDGTAPFTYLVAGMPTGVTFDGARTLTVAPSATGILKVQVAVADVAALPSTARTLTIQGQSNLTAATAYPASMHGGDENNPNWGVGLFYSNEMSNGLYVSGTVLSYAQPVRADQTVDVNGTGNQGLTLLYDNGQDGNGNTDWEAVPAGGMTSGRFMLQGWLGGVERLRVGYGGSFPPYLPHMADSRATSAQAGRPGFVDLARAMPPIDGTAPFTYSVRSSSDRLDDYPGYTTIRTAPGVSNVPGASFDGTHAVTLDGTTPQGTYALKVTVSDANGYQSPAATLYVDVQSSVLASAAYPTDIHKGCCYGPDIPTGTAYSENLTRERDDGAYSWYVTFAQPVQLDGTIDYVGDENTPAIFAYQPVIDQWNWVETPQVPVTGPVSASHLRLQGTQNGDGAARLRLGDAGAFPDFLPTVYASTHPYLIGGSLSVPLSAAMAVRDVKGAATFTLADGTSLPAGTSSDGATLTGSIADAGPYAPHLAASDSRGFTSRGQAWTLTGTTPADPTFDGAYQVADYADASVRAGKPVNLAAPALTGPWLAPRFALNGTLPAGLAFNADGSVTGTPAADLAAPLALTVTVTDAYGYNVTTDPFHLVPYGYLSLADGTLHATYMEPAPDSLRTALSAVGDADGTTWKVTSGTMPGGLTLNLSSGALDGTATAMAGPTQLTIQATSATGRVATANLSIQVTMRSTTFDGSSNYVTLPDIATTFGGGASFAGLTVAAWVDFSNGGRWERILEMAAGDSGYDAIALGRPSDGFDGIYDNVSGPEGGGNIWTNNGLVPRNSWHYVAMTQSGRANTIYVDGAVQATGNQGTPVATSRPYSWIGRSSYGSDSLFGGQMADVQVYDRALSQGELATTATGTSVAGLVGRYLTGHSQRADLSGVAGPAAPAGAFATTEFTPPSVGGGNVPVAASVSESGMCEFLVGSQGTTGGNASQYPCTETIDDLLRGNQLNPYAHPAIYGYYDLRDLKVGDAVGPDRPKVLGALTNPRFSIFPALPAGLALGADGAISGKLQGIEPLPTAFVVTVTDDTGATAKTEVSMTFSGMGATLTDATRTYDFDTNGIDETASNLLSAQSLPADATWQVTTGAFPPGMKMDSSGHITGGVVHVGKYPVRLSAVSQNTIVATGTVTFVVPYVAGTYDGNSYMTLPSSTTSAFFDSNGAFTGYAIAAWVNFADVRAWERVWDFGAGGGGYDDMYLARSGGDGVFRIQSTQGGDLGGRIVPGKWTHMVATMTPTGLLTLYQDGSVVMQDQRGIPDDVDRPLSFLGASTYGDPYFAGQMADVQVYGNPISQANVQAIMQGSRGDAIRHWYMIGIYPDYDAAQGFDAPTAHSKITGNIGQALFMPPYAPGN